MTRYAVTSRRADGSTHVGTIISAGDWMSPEDLARTYAESLGHEFVSVEEEHMGEQKDPLKRESQQPDAQNKDVEERVDKQTIDTKQATPNKTGDVRPNR